jgi:hypothetical protein
MEIFTGREQQAETKKQERKQPYCKEDIVYHFFN